MAHFSPAYAKHFNTGLMAAVDIAGVDPDAFTMTRRRPILRLETRSRWKTSINTSLSPEIEKANEEFRNFQIKCYTSLPPSTPVSADDSPVILAPSANKNLWALPFALLYHCFALLFTLFITRIGAVSATVASTARAAGARVQDCIYGLIYDVWAPRKLRLMRFVSRAVPCLLCGAFIFMVLAEPRPVEAELTYVLRHHCVIQSGPFEMQDGLKTQ